jgi:hypothetical protein
MTRPSLILRRHTLSLPPIPSLVLPTRSVLLFSLVRFHLNSYQNSTDATQKARSLPLRRLAILPVATPMVLRIPVLLLSTKPRTPSMMLPSMSLTLWLLPVSTFPIPLPLKHILHRLLPISRSVLISSSADALKGKSQDAKAEADKSTST